jgi:hypothetical protein
MIKYFDILKQYVNTGEAIPEYQLEKVFKMGRGLPKSYFRARFNIINDIDSDVLEDYEVFFLQKLPQNVKGGFLSNLKNIGVRLQLMDVKDRDEAIEQIINDNDFYSDNIKMLLKFSSNPEKLAEKIVKVKKMDLFLRRLEITDLFKYTKNNHARLIEMIFNELGVFLDDDIMYSILLSSNTPKVLESILGQALYDNIKKFSNVLLKYLLVNSPNINDLISVLLNSGITKEKINRIIKHYKLNIPLIPN